MTNTNTLNSFERACAELLRNGQAVTFTAVAARTGLGRTALYRPNNPGHHRGEPSLRHRQRHSHRPHRRDRHSSRN